MNIKKLILPSLLGAFLTFSQNAHAVDGNLGAGDTITPGTAIAVGHPFFATHAGYYILEDCEDLQSVQSRSEHYNYVAIPVSGNVIDCAETNPANRDGSYSGPWGATGFDSLHPSAGYRGTFDFNGVEVANLFIDDSAAKQGIFGTIHTNGMVKNLYMTNVDITTTGEIAGAVVGNLYGSIENVFVDGGSIAAQGYAGGVIGQAIGSSISDVHVRLSSVSATNIYAGGVVGFMSMKATAQNSYASVSSISSASQGNVGGFAGVATSSSVINNVYASGSVSGPSSFPKGRIVGNALSVSGDGGYFNGTCSGCNSTLATTASPSEYLTEPGFIYNDGVGTDWDFSTVWEYVDGINGGMPVLRVFGLTLPPTSVENAIAVVSTIGGTKGDRAAAALQVVRDVNGDDFDTALTPGTRDSQISSSAIREAMKSASGNASAFAAIKDAAVILLDLQTEPTTEAELLKSVRKWRLKNG